MRQSDKAFLELYEVYKSDALPLTNAEKDALYERVMERAGTKRERPRKSRKILLAAAVAMTAILAVAATWYGVSDAFRGVLLERNDNGEPGPVALMSPLVDSAGKLLDSKAESGGLEVSLRAVVGDEKIIKLLVDVTDLSGSGLAIRQPDGTLSTGDLRFDGMALEIIDHPKGYEGFEDRGRYRGNMSGSYGNEVIGGKPGDNKLTFLIEYDVSEDFSIRGRTFRLALYDLMQLAAMDGTSSGMKPGELYDAASQFSGHTDSDFEIAGYSHDHQTGVTTYQYRLIRDGGQSLPLCGATPDFLVTNAAIRDGVLYLRGTASAFQEWERLSHNANLINEATGAVLHTVDKGENVDDSGMVTWTISFEGINSVEELKDYVWVYDYGEGFYPLREGPWNLEFTLDYENTTRSIEMDRAFQWEGYNLTMKRVEISPFGLMLMFTADAAVYNEMNPERAWDAYHEDTLWQSSQHLVSIQMKDGMTITAVDPTGSSFISSGAAEGEFRMDYSFEAIIDPSKAAVVKIGELEVRMEDAGESSSSGG